MSISPALAEELAGPVVEVYAEAERLLLNRIGASLAQGLDAPGWAERKLLEVQLLQRHAAADLVAANATGTATAAANIARAWNRGAAGAEHDIARAVLGGLRVAVPTQASLEAITGELVTSLRAVEQRVLRAVPDVYREVIRAAAPQVLVGVQTRREAAQAALDQLAARGITGFTDRSDRRWALDSYVEMATRAATARAAVDGHTRRLTERGYGLIAVSDAPQECALCRPFEGKVLAITAEHLGEHTSMTLDQARARGLFHPGCRHSTGLYQPGLTVLPVNTADPEGDAARAKLRRLERELRAARRSESVALDPQAHTKARARIRAKQAQIREHVATTPAKRQPWREQLRGPKPVAADPFTRRTDAELDELLMAEFEKPEPDQALLERVQVEMDMRERYAGSDISEHYRRRNTALDDGFAGQSDEEITELIEQAVASGDPAAGAFVNEAHLELRNRTYAGKNAHRAVVRKVVKPRTESRAAKLRRARDDYELYLEAERSQLEQATNGNLIRRDRLAEFRQKYGSRQMDTMLEGDPATAYRYASEEVRRYWDGHPRRTFAEFALEAVGEDPALQAQVERQARRARDAAVRAEERPRRRR